MAECLQAGMSARPLPAAQMRLCWEMPLPGPKKLREGDTGTLKEIIFGPARLDDGTQNLVGALQTSMGSLGVRSIKEMQSVEVIIAPSIQTEGKVFQAAQKVGMRK